MSNTEKINNFNAKLKIDEVDKEIIQLLQKNPEMTHSEISEKVHKSQPAVGARIIKLRRKNLLATQIGVNFKKVDIKLAKVTMLVKNVGELLSKFEQCPFVLHAFKISGNTNLLVLIAAPDIQTIDQMVDTCWRSHPDIITINVSYIISSVKDLILPVNFDIEFFGEFGCGREGCMVHHGETDKLKQLIRDSRKKALESDIEK
jgi:Lrp/AsnC family leucine-responsive transcriptional regulator